MQGGVVASGSYALGASAHRNCSLYPGCRPAQPGFRAAHQVYLALLPQIRSPLLHSLSQPVKTLSPLLQRSWQHSIPICRQCQRMGRTADIVATHAPQASLQLQASAQRRSHSLARISVRLLGSSSNRRACRAGRREACLQEHPPLLVHTLATGLSWSSRGPGERRAVSTASSHEPLHRPR